MLIICLKVFTVPPLEEQMMLPMAGKFRIIDDLSKLEGAAMTVLEFGIGGIVDGATYVVVNYPTPYQKLCYWCYHLPVFELPHNLSPPLVCWLMDQITNYQPALSFHRTCS